MTAILVVLGFTGASAASAADVGQSVQHCVIAGPVVYDL